MDRVFAVSGMVPSRMTGLRFDDLWCAGLSRVRVLPWFLVAAESFAHRRKNFFSESMFLSGTKTCEQRRGQHFGRHRLIDCGIHRPAAFSGILDETRIAAKRGVFRQS